MLVAVVAHEELFHLEAARIPPRDTDQERVGARAASKAGGFGVKEKPIVLVGRFVWSLRREQTQRWHCHVAGRGIRKPAAHGEMLAMACFLQRRAEQASEIFRAFWSSRRVAARLHVCPFCRGFQRGDTTEAIFIHHAHFRVLAAKLVMRHATELSKQLPLPSRSFLQPGRRTTGNRSRVRWSSRS